MYRYSRFSSFASRVARTLGHPMTFMFFLGAAVLWLASGPLFHFSGNWYSSYSNMATIVTTLLLFLIQHTQSREIASIHLKLNEIIRVSEGAHNALLDIEELTDRDYDLIKANYTALARQAREQLQSGKVKWATARVSMESLDSFLDPSLTQKMEDEEIKPVPSETKTVPVEAIVPEHKSSQKTFSPRLVPVLERMARIAAHSGHAPRALVAFNDQEHGWLQQEVGFDAQAEETGARQQTPLAQFLVAQVVASQQPVVVADVAGGLLPPEVSDGARIDAFLVVPLVAAHQRVIGCLAVLDAQARPWHDAEIAALQDLAALTVEQVTEQVRTAPAPSETQTLGATQNASAPSSPSSAPVPATETERKAEMQDAGRTEAARSEAPALNTILVVDDSETNRTLLRRRLEREGYRVIMAGNGQEALDRLNAEPVGLTLLDVMMPEMDGEEVLQKMQADNQLRNIPVIVVSALDEQASVERCLQSGAKDYILKPFDPVQLRACVHTYLPPPPAQDAAA